MVDRDAGVLLHEQRVDLLHGLLGARSTSPYLKSQTVSVTFVLPAGQREPRHASDHQDETENRSFDHADTSFEGMSPAQYPAAAGAP